MPRMRTIKPDTFIDPDLGQLGFAARYFFIGLWCCADREGRLRDEPKKLAVQIIPFDLNRIEPEALLSELTPRFIRRYEAAGRRYIQIVNFSRHQRPNIKESPSEIPPEHEKESASTKIKVLARLIKGKGKGTEKGSAGADDCGFEQFWQSFPKRVGKKAARAAWGRIQPSQDLLKRILRALEAHRLNDQWQKDSGRYIPYPATWLNQERWEDEIAENLNKDGDIYA